MYKDVKDKLVAILETLIGSPVDDNQPLAAVYGFLNPLPASFPAACVRVSGTTTEERFDSANNLENMEFTVRVLFPADNSQEAEDKRLLLMAAIPALFRKAANVDTLDGLVESFTIIGSVPININEGSPLMGFDISVVASKLMLITL